MNKYIVEVSQTAKNDLDNIIIYIRNSLFDDIQEKLIQKRTSN